MDFKLRRTAIVLLLPMSMWATAQELNQPPGNYIDCSKVAELARHIMAVRQDNIPYLEIANMVKHIDLALELARLAYRVNVESTSQLRELAVKNYQQYIKSKCLLHSPRVL